MATIHMVEVWHYHSYGGGVVLPVVRQRCGYQSYGGGVVLPFIWWRCGATIRSYHSYGGAFVWWWCGATSRMMEVWCYQSYDRGVVLSVV